MDTVTCANFDNSRYSFVFEYQQLQLLTVESPNFYVFPSDDIIHFALAFEKLQPVRFLLKMINHAARAIVYYDIGFALGKLTSGLAWHKVKRAPI